LPFVPQFVIDESREQTGSSPLVRWNQLKISEAVARILEAADGRSASELAESLATDEICADDWLDPITRLVGAGLLEPRLPSFDPSARGIREFASRLSELGGAKAGSYGSLK